MDCKQALELITASLDGELDQRQDTDLHHHLSNCSRCRNEIELEGMTKSLVSRHVRRSTTPPAVANRIGMLLEQELHREPVPTAAWHRLLTPSVRKTVFALTGAAAVLAALVIFFPSGSRHSHIVPNDGNIINRTYSGFDGVLQGSILPQVSSSDPSVLKAFFTPRVNFNVDVPPLHSCTLMGGLFSNYNNVGVAQVIYKHEDDMIYLYEARLESVMNGGALNLPQEARNELLRTGWYVENHTPDCTLIVWKADSTTICCAVAEMSKDHLMACLKDVH